MITRRYVKAAAALAIQAVIAVGVLAALARILGPTDFGVTVLLNTIVTIGTIVFGAGAQAAVLVSIAGPDDDRASVHGAAIGLALVATAVLVAMSLLLAPWLTTALHLPAGAPLVIVTALRIPPTLYASLVFSALSGSGAIGWLGILTIVGAASTIAAPIGALAADDPLAGAVLGSLVGSVAWAAIAFAVGQRNLGVGMPRSRLLWRRLFGVAIPLHVGTVAYWVMLRADAFLVNAILGPASVGLYGLALSLADRVGFVTSPIYNATAAVVSGPDRPAAVRIVLDVVRLEIALAAVLALGTFALAPLVVTVIGGPAYAAAASPLVVLVIGAALLPIWPTVGLFLVAHVHGAWLTARVQVAIAAISLAAYAIAIQIDGIMGAALVSTGSYLLLATTGLLMARRLVGFSLRDVVPGPSDFGRLVGVMRDIWRTPGRSPSGPPSSEQISPHP